MIDPAADERVRAAGCAAGASRRQRTEDRPLRLSLSWSASTRAPRRHSDQPRSAAPLFTDGRCRCRSGTKGPPLRPAERRPKGRSDERRRPKEPSRRHSAALRHSAARSQSRLHAASRSAHIGRGPVRGSGRRGRRAARRSAAARLTQPEPPAEGRSATQRSAAVMTGRPLLAHRSMRDCCECI